MACLPIGRVLSLIQAACFPFKHPDTSTRSLVNSSPPHTPHPSSPGPISDLVFGLETWGGGFAGGYIWPGENRIQGLKLPRGQMVQGAFERLTSTVDLAEGQGSLHPQLYIGVYRPQLSVPADSPCRAGAACMLPRRGVCVKAGLRPRLPASLPCLAPMSVPEGAWGTRGHTSLAPPLPPPHTQTCKATPRAWRRGRPPW